MVFKIILVLVFTMNALGVILLIGDERKPITNGSAAATVFILGLLIMGVMYSF